MTFHQHPYNDCGHSRSLLDSLMGVVRVFVVLWLCWIALVLVVVLFTDAPVVGFVLTAGALLLAVRFLRARRRRYKHRFSALHRAKAEHYRNERMRRAEQYPEVVFAENAPLWAKEWTP